MASITFNYDGRNALIKNIFKTAIMAGATQICANTPMSAINKSLKDVSMGRVYSAKNAKDLIKQCLN
jgi:hypothetical protein